MVMSSRSKQGQKSLMEYEKKPIKINKNLGSEGGEPKQNTQ